MGGHLENKNGTRHHLLVQETGEMHKFTENGHAKN
jgi:hypothetical protein